MDKEKKPFTDWLKHPKPIPEGQEYITRKWKCANCGEKNERRKSTMDIAICDFCWHCRMASTF